LITERLKALKNARSSVKAHLGDPIYFDKETESQPKYSITNQVVSYRVG